MQWFHFFIIIFAISVSTKAEANTIVVCTDCIENNISQAVLNSKPGDTICIENGVYLENPFLITHRLTLQGENWPQLISKEGEELITVVADSVTISGLHFKNVQTSFLEERAAVRLKNCKYFIIEGNQFENNFFAIYLQQSSYGKISNNYIKGNAKEEASSGNAIHAWYCKNLEIIDNTVIGHRDGIYFEFVDNSIIKRNHSEGNLRYGLHFMFSNDDIYQNNEFKDNGAGVAVMFSRRIEMLNNLFDLNWGSNSYGLLLKEIFDAEILNNRFHQNTIGIFVESSNRVNYKYNDFEGNGWAIKVSGGCQENVYSKNNFIHNTFDFSVISTFSDSKLEYNYWSEYNGYDLDRNGIGDIPYRPMKLFSYITQQSEESIILMRSLFVDLLNFSEKVSPVFTPLKVEDQYPLLYPYEN